MHGTVPCRFLRVAAILLAAWPRPGACGQRGRAGGGLGGSRPIPEALWPGDASVDVTWSGPWEAAYAAAAKRWKKQLESEEKNVRRRDGRLRYRLVRLLEAMSAQFGDGDERRIRVGLKMAGHLEVLRYFGRANYARRGIIDGFPGRVRLAASQLEAILDKTHSVYLSHTLNGHAWLEYAAERLLALNRAGLLADSHPAVSKAMRALTAVERGRGGLFEAAEWIARLRAAGGADGWSAAAEADLLLQAGRRLDALARWEKIDLLSSTSTSRGRVNALRASGGDAPPMFPRALGLEMRWEALRGVRPGEQAEAFVSLIESAAGESGLMQHGPAGRTSVWSALDGHLRSQPAAELAAIRQASEAGPAELLAGTGGLDDRRLLEAYRRRPWAAGVHRALVRAGQRALREGRAGWAVRAFRDVLDHSADGARRAEARAGLWLALSQDASNRAELVRALEHHRRPGRDVLLPWAGRRQKATAILKSLLSAEAAPDAEPVSLTSLRRTDLQLAAGAWPIELLEALPSGLRARFPAGCGRLQAAGDGALLSGPSLLACYPAGAARPSWQRTDPLLTDPTPGPAVRYPLPGEFRPAVAAGWVYSRWGLDGSRRFPTALAAFDLRDGRMVWCSSGRPLWRGIRPISDPAVADGRVYALGLSTGQFTPTWVFCMDAATGEVLWRRMLAVQSVPLASGWPGGRVTIDSARYGNAVTVHEAEVYCSTNQGYVAKLDARDGLGLWARTYRRALLTPGSADRFRRRQGGRPIVTAGRVVLAPRDRHGVFALDAATGELLWDSALVGSDEVVGLYGQTLLVSDSTHLTALATDTGKVRWTIRLDEPMLASPRLTGPSVLLATGRGLCRVDARSGRIAESVPWGRARPAREMVLSAGRLVAVAAQSVSRAPPAQALQVAARPAAGKPFGLPVQRIWHLPRRTPRLVAAVSPAGAPEPAGKDGLLHVLADGVLEQVEVRTGRSRWRRMIGAGLLSVGRHKGLLLIGQARRLLGIDAASGRLRWQAPLPFEATAWRFFPGCTVAGHFPRGPHCGRTRVGCIDPDSGSLLWHRSFRDDFAGVGGPTYCRDAAWDGRNIHLIWPSLSTGRGTGLHAVAVRPADGQVLSVRRVDETASLVAARGDCFYYMGKDRRLRRQPLGPAGKTVAFANVYDYQPAYYAHLRSVRPMGRWLAVRYFFSSPVRKFTTSLSDLSDPTYAFRVDGRATLEADKAFAATASKLTCWDLRTRRGVEYRCSYANFVPGTYSPRHWWRQGPTLFVVSGARPSHYPRFYPPHLQIDAFDLRTARPSGWQVLPGVGYWLRGAPYYVDRSQFARHGGVLVVTDAAGLHAFAASKPVAQPACVAYRAANPVKADGLLDEWDPAGGVHLAGPGRAGRLLLAHDGEKLYLAVRYRAREARPMCGGAECPGGDWLEIAFGRSLRCAVGRDGRGRFVCRPFGDGKPPDGVAGAVRHDPSAGAVTYEVAVPLASLGRNVSEVGVSVVVWLDRPRQGRQRAMAWGGALRGARTDVAHHERVRLAPLSRRVEASALALADRTVEMDRSFDLLRESIRLHAASPEACVAPCTRFLRSHPSSWRCLPILQMLDGALRTARSDPSVRILKLAAGAGVSKPVRDAYARSGRAYLSQWVYVERPPRMLCIRLAGGKTRSRRVIWGRIETYGTPVDFRPWPSPMRYGGCRPRTGHWTELRVPLLWLGISDRPITAVSLGQYGGEVCWDRTAIVAGGAEHVLIDDSFAEGKAAGSFQWVGAPVRSGHAALKLVRATETKPWRETTFTLAAPLAAHVVAPPAGKAPDPRKLAAVVLPGLAGLGSTALAHDYLQALLGAEADALRKAELCKAFVRALPRHPRALAVLRQAYSWQVAADPKGGRKAIEAFVESASLPPGLVYDFNRRYLYSAHNYVLGWQVLAPLPAGAPGPSPERIALDRRHAGIAGRVGWRTRLAKAKDGWLRLAETYPPQPDAVAYAACWVFAARARTVALELSFGGAGQAWVNGRAVFSGLTPGAASSAIYAARVNVPLPAGWSTLLLRADAPPDAGKAKAKAPWAFRVDIVDPAGRGPADIRVAAAPPAPASGPAP